MKNIECDCLIGIINKYDQISENDLYLSDYINKIDIEVKTANFLNKELYNKITNIIGNDYLDRRKGFTRLFNYCPNCGSKINYKILKENLRNI